MWRRRENIQRLKILLAAHSYTLRRANAELQTNAFSQINDATLPRPLHHLHQVKKEALPKNTNGCCEHCLF